jgi:Coenzyme Q (ubiquinone) biosynthesis protein Coq4
MPLNDQPTTHYSPIWSTGLEPSSRSPPPLLYVVPSSSKPLKIHKVKVAMSGARVSLNGWQRAAVAMGSALGALMDPRRADLIAALGETTGKPAFDRVLQRMKNNAEGRVSFIDQNLYVRLKFIYFLLL